MCKKESSDEDKEQLEVVIVFCSNCGSPLAEGAKFCSECGTKVEETKVRDFGTLEIDEPASVTDTLAGKAMGAEEAFDARVSFDWSNVIDEPQRKEVPQGIKSPWAATTDNIDEREIYSEMTQSDDKNRTMGYIDLLKADKEERERAALDRSIEYTEVLEYDPEMVGGTKPPKLRMAPLYEDVDAPVKTPFDDIETDGPEDEYLTSEEPAEKETVSEEAKAEPAPSKFELPNFLKMAAGFGAGKDEVVDIKREAEEEAPVAEEAPAEEPVMDEAPAEESKAEETPVAETSAEDEYLDEDLYLELSEEPRSDRVSRVMAHTDEYEVEEDDDDDEDEIESDDDDEAVDEKELFSEMTEAEPKKTGMTIAAPADEEAEIEALKKRLAELTGTVEIDPELIKEAEEDKKAEPEKAQAGNIVEDTVEEPAEEGSFEAMGADFTFEPEVTEADDAFFAGLTAASEPVATAAAVETTPEPSYEDFMFEPEVTSAEDELFAGLTAASETAAKEEPVPEEVPAAEPTFGLSLDDEITANKPEVVEEPQAAEPAVEEPTAAEPAAEEPEAEPTVEDLLAKYVPQYFGADADKPAETPAAEPEPVSEPEPAADDSPIVGFAPAVTEAPKEEAFDARPAAPEAPVIRLDDFEAEPAEPVKPVEEAPVVPAAPAVPETPAAPKTPAAEEPKTSDAVSLDELEDLFGSQAGEGTKAETTKKIDKFYTLYRKNEEFQRLLDEEYSRLKGENIEIPEDDAPIAGLAAAATAEEASAAADEAAPKEAEKAPVDFSATAILEELGESKTPVEDATIYRDLPPEIAEINETASNAEVNSGFSVEGTEAKGLGLGDTDATAVAGAAAAGTAVAGAAMTKAEKKAAKKAEKKARKEAAAAAQVEYEDVDSGSTVLTILAVIVAVLLVVLLAIILVLHIAPNSELALSIDEFIENITSRFSAANTFGGHWLL